MIQRGHLIYPDAASVLKRDFYVNDLLSRGNSVDEAVNLVKNLEKNLKGDVFPLRKWYLNSDKFYNCFLNPSRDLKNSCFKI